jgi:small subunit ribosomal protein S29
LNWDLPKETDDRKFRLLTSVDSTRGIENEQQRDAAKAAESQWPPPALEMPALVAKPVKRPHLWLNSKGMDPPDISIEDAGRFLRVTRDDLVKELLPEGACGELARDITLIPPPAPNKEERDIGIMLRKPAIELIYQLQRLQNAKDAKGEFRISKAGFLIDGHKGAGKSQVLNTLAMWARRNGWLVVMEPVPSRYSKEIAEIKRSNAGVYIQNEFAQAFLEMTSLANREKFEEIPVDLGSYGQRAIDGEPVKETRRLYEPLIEKTVDQEVTDKGLPAVERLRRIAAYKKQVRMPSMVDHLPRPATAWEIVEFGLQNEAYASQAVAELFVQLQRQTAHPVLVIVDEWNECFPISDYVSIRYDNTRFHGYIPAYHLTMPRTFHRWDGHLYRRGLKICATSWMRFKRRDYRPELLGIKDYELRTVRNFSPHEFANFVAYYRLMNILHNFPREDLEYYYMLTQGNGFQARRVLSTLY